VFGHVVPHIEFAQKGIVVGQMLPHMPQFEAFDLVSTHETPHIVLTHCAPAPATPFDAPPTPGELPLPATPGLVVGVLAEQLMASKAGNASVSDAPTSCARNAPLFSRNRFHIRTPNLKVRRLSFEGLRRRATSALCDLHRSVPTVARRSARESAQKSTLSLKLQPQESTAKQRRARTLPNS
jgi:hypothetical protein